MSNFFVDFSAGVDGSGNSTVSPYNTIVGKTFSSNDTVWIRRAGSLTLAASLAITKANFQGWPIGSAWNGVSDSQPYAIIQSTSKSHIIVIGDPSDITLSVNGFKLIKLINTDATATSSDSVWVTCYSQPGIDSCYFAASQDVVVFNAPAFSAAQGIITNCTFECLSSSGGTNGNAIITPSDHTSIIFKNCVFKNTGAYSGGRYYLCSPQNTHGSQIGFYNCTFTITAGNVGVMTTVPAQDDAARTVLIDCVVDDHLASSPTFLGMFLRGSTFARNLSITGTGLRVGPDPILDIHGPTRGSSIHLSKLAQTVAMTNCLEAYGSGTTITILNYAPGTGLTVCDPGVRLRIVNGSCSNRQPNLEILDEAGTSGAWHGSDVGGDARKDSVFRTGGAPFSIKATYDVDSLSKIPIIMSKPGAESLIARLPAGARTLTLFLAYKNITPTKQDLWFDIPYYDGSTTHRSVASSRTTTALDSDSSTWSDGTLTAAKIVLTLTSNRDSMMPIRIFYRKYSATGVVYIDPRIMVS